MQLQGLAVQHFRNHGSAHWLFNQPVCVIVGANAQGKTSILEAISLLSGVDSFRATAIEEMITFEKELARVKGVVVEGDSQHKIELEVLLTRGLVQGKRTQRRLFSVNGVRRQKRTFAGQLLSIVFRPEDMRLIEGSPGRRRSFLDSALSLVSGEYATSLHVYEQALQRRNKLLVAIREGEMPRSVLGYWSQQLIKHGQVVQQHRQAMLSHFNGVSFPLLFTVEYQSSVMSAERLAQYSEAEVAAGHTLVGPHKDDIIVLLDGKDVSIYGSRGQQRMAVLWLKLAELDFVESKKGQKVVLLLDDILSELDEHMRELVLAMVHDRQVIMTTAEPQRVEEVKKVVKGAVQVVEL